MDTIIDFLWDWKWLIILYIIGSQLKKVWDMYNRIQELLQGVHEAKSNIAVILNQKIEIINKFYAVVSQYDGYEKIYNYKCLVTTHNPQKKHLRQ